MPEGVPYKAACSCAQPHLLMPLCWLLQLLLLQPCEMLHNSAGVYWTIWAWHATSMHCKAGSLCEQAYSRPLAGRFAFAYATLSKVTCIQGLHDVAHCLQKGMHCKAAPSCVPLCLLLIPCRLLQLLLPQSCGMQSAHQFSGHLQIFGACL